MMEDEDKEQLLFEIYGASGVNRWKVRGNGQVAFARGFAADQKYTDKAEELGFEII